MPRELLQARFDPDTVEAVEEYAEERDISRSEAMRRLLRAGLEEANDDGEELVIANISPIVRVVGGVLVVVAALLVILSELGLL